MGGEGESKKSKGHNENCRKAQRMTNHTTLLMIAQYAKGFPVRFGMEILKFTSVQGPSGTY
ncbi:hypothetical protein SBDP1_170015 [Syntrophobacter sp. SbD1]|nr:hypothetical protein SBDP1_170015 [Syntrophobacter sp. SbD1]